MEHLTNAHPMLLTQLWKSVEYFMLFTFLSGMILLSQSIIDKNALRLAEISDDIYYLDGFISELAKLYD